MNKDLLNIIERYSIQNNIANCNKQYREKCQYTYGFSGECIMFTTKKGTTLSYNYRRTFTSRKMLSYTPHIFNMDFTEVAILPINY